METTKEKLRWLALEAQKHNKSFIAMDDDLLWYAFEKRPEYHVGQWHGGGEYVCLTPTDKKASEQIFEVTKLLNNEL